MPQPFHQITALAFHQHILELEVDGKTVQCDLSLVAPQLAQAPPQQQAVFEVSPTGYGIYWPLLDIDLAIEPLIGNRAG